MLLVLQGTDTAGKGGVVTHVVGAFGPIGVEYTALEEADRRGGRAPLPVAHPQAAARPGTIGVFDRSHYEDVLVPWVHRSIDDAEQQRRFAEINAFEAELAAGGTTVIKCLLHISNETQRERLLARLDDPHKHWKFNPADLAERAHWDEYQVGLRAAAAGCNTAAAPWYVVPSDSKKYRNWAVGQLLLETLTELDPQYPPGHLNVAELEAAVRAS